MPDGRQPIVTCYLLCPLFRSFFFLILNFEFWLISHALHPLKLNTSQTFLSPQRNGVHFGFCLPEHSANLYQRLFFSPSIAQLLFHFCDCFLIELFLIRSVVWLISYCRYKFSLTEDDQQETFMMNFWITVLDCHANGNQRVAGEWTTALLLSVSWPLRPRPLGSSIESNVTINNMRDVAAGSRLHL